MNIWLKEIELTDGIEFFELLNELASYNDAYAKPIPEEMPIEDFEDFKKARIKLKLGVYKNISPVSTYFVMCDDRPIGYATLRHEVDMNKIGGHLGCCLLKDFQNKGIGSIVSEMLSKIAYEDLKIEEIVYTVKKENIQSQKSLQNIGVEYLFEKDGYYFYKVDLIKKFSKGERK